MSKCARCEILLFHFDCFKLGAWAQITKDSKDLSALK